MSQNVMVVGAQQAAPAALLRPAVPFALSDVYAMGGEPFLALAIAAFPADLPKDISGSPRVTIAGGAAPPSSVSG